MPQFKKSKYTLVSKQVGKQKPIVTLSRPSSNYLFTLINVAPFQAILWLEFTSRLGASQ